MPEVIEHSNADIYAIVRIEDPDEGRHGKVDSLEIVDGDAEAHFRIRQPSIDEPNEFNIEVLRLLDREISPYGYNLTLKVSIFIQILRYVSKKAARERLTALKLSMEMPRLISVSGSLQ